MRSLARSFSHRVSVEKPNSAATASTMRSNQRLWPPVHGEMAPSSSDRVGSGTTRSGSTSNWVPSPSHAGHAP